MRLLTVFLVFALSATCAQAQDASLPEPLQALLEAAASDTRPDKFEAAVDLLSLTQSPDAIVAGAAQMSADHAARARAVLGVDIDAAGVGTAEGIEDATIEDAVSTPGGWRAIPIRAVDTLANGQSEFWSGQLRAGFRQDNGNSDQLDYTLALAVERDLTVWGFQGAVEYGYSESGGAVGRDALIARTQLDREIGERWTIFTGARYEQDALSGFDWTSLVDAGFGYRILTGDVRTWKVQAGPAVRILQPVNEDMRTVAAAELSSDLDWQLNDTLLFTADTQMLLTDQSRFEQSFALQTSLGELWALQLSYRYRNEFDPEPGFEDVDTRTDISIVREF